MLSNFKFLRSFTQTGFLREIAYRCHSMNAVACFDGNNTYFMFCESRT